MEDIKQNLTTTDLFVFIADKPEPERWLDLLLVCMLRVLVMLIAYNAKLRGAPLLARPLERLVGQYAAKVIHRLLCSRT